MNPKPMSGNDKQFLFCGLCAVLGYVLAGPFGGGYAFCYSIMGTALLRLMLLR